MVISYYLPESFSSRWRRRSACLSCASAGKCSVYHGKDRAYIQTGALYHTRVACVGACSSSSGNPDHRPRTGTGSVLKEENTYLGIITDTDLYSMVIIGDEPGKYTTTG